MIFPARSLVLLSPLSPTRAQEVLQAALTQPRKWQDRLTMTGGGGFMGDVKDGRFNLRRDINYRNSFLPLLTGKIEPASDGGGSRISTRMTMHRAVKIFLCVWLFGVASIGVPLAIAAINGTLQPNQNSWMGIVIPCGMMCFGLALPHLGFWPEVKKAEKFMIETWGAETELPPDPNRAI